MTFSSAIIAAAAGLGAGLSLIVAIGAQNAFVLRQGVQRRHVLAVVSVCAISDAILIAAGVAGMGFIVEAAPTALTFLRYAGAAFLLGYAILAARRAFAGGALTPASGRPGAALSATIATCLALTWLNPHVYVDTVLLLGSIANGYAGSERWFLGLGAMLGSLIWFVMLGYGARLLTPLFARPAAWRIFDGCIAAIMLTIAAALVLGAG